MRRSLLSFCLASSFAAASTAAGEAVTVLGNGQRQSHDCHGGNAAVDGNDNVLAFRNCSKLAVNGSRNVIDAGAVSALSLFGNGNKVTWAEGPGARQAKVVDVGSNNAVIKGTGLPQYDKAGGAPANGDESVTLRTTSGSGVLETTAGNVLVSGDGQRSAHDCRGGTALVNGNRNVVAFSNCRTIVINGDQNTVTWIEASGATPKVVDTGKGNSVSKAAK